MSPNDLLAASYRMARQMIHRMVDDLTQEDFQHQPVPGSNSAAWIVGHLGVTARRTAERLGATELPELTEEFVARFSVWKRTFSSSLFAGVIATGQVTSESFR